MACFATSGSEITCCTPSTFCIRQENSSIDFIDSWLTQAGSRVSTITVRMSTPIENSR
jgi:hypothetical protein